MVEDGVGVSDTMSVKKCNLVKSKESLGKTNMTWHGSVDWALRAWYTQAATRNSDLIWDHETSTIAMEVPCSPAGCVAPARPIRSLWPPGLALRTQKLCFFTCCRLAQARVAQLWQYWHFGPDNFLFGSCHVHSRIFSNSPGLHPQDASSTS